MIKIKSLGPQYLDSVVLSNSTKRIVFFFIGNKDLYSRTPPYAEKHKAENKIQRVRKECKRERKEKKLST